MGSVASPSDTRYFTLDLAEEATVVIDLVGDEIDAFLTLHATDDPATADFTTVVGVDDDGGEGLNSRIVQPLAAGTYLIAAGTIGGGGAFTLSVLPADINVSSIGVGETATGALASSSSTDYYTLTLSEATPIAIDLISSEFDPLLELYETDDPVDADFRTFLAVDDDGGGGLNSRITRVLPAGTYLIAAKSFGGFGAYDLTVSEETFETLAISVGESAPGTLPTPADVNFYTLTLSNDLTVAIDLRSEAFDAFLEVFETDTPLGADFSTLVASDDDGGFGFDSRIVRALTAGTYLVGVSAFSGAGDYVLEVAEEVIEVDAIALGESRSGTLESSSDTHYFTLDLPEGAAIAIDAISDEMDPFLDLFDTDNPLEANFFTQLSADDDGGEGLNSRIEVALPPGIYLVGVSPIGSGGAYTLSVSEFDIEVASISVGESVTGSLSSSEEVLYFALRVETAAAVTIDMTSDEFDTFLQVFDADNPADAGFFNLLAEDDDGGEGLNSRTALPLAPGTYLIAAQAFGGAGAFSLSVTEEVQQLSSISVGESRTGELLADLDRDFYTLTLTDKTTVSISLTSDAFDAFLELYDADNALAADSSTLLAVDDDGGEGLNSQLMFSLSEGTYLIGALSFSGIGVYDLSVTEAESELLTVALGGTESGELSSLTSVDFYLLSLDEGTSVVIDLTSDAFDTFLELYAADNLFDATDVNFITLDDDGGVDFNSQIQTALGAGAYVIAVSSLDAPGGYTLSVTGGGSLPVTPIALGETASSSLVSETDVAFFTFSLDSETAVTVDLTSDEFDAFLELARGDNPFQVDIDDLLALDDDGGEGLNSRIDLALEAGTYLLAVTSFSGAGAFDIQLVGGTSAVGPNARASVTLDFEASGSVNLIDDAVTTGSVTGGGTEIVFEVFVNPVGRSISGGSFALEIDADLLELTDFKPATGLSAEILSVAGDVLISSTEGGVLLDEGFFGSATLTTLSDVTGRQLGVGVREFTLTDEATGTTDEIRTRGGLRFNALSPTTVVSGEGPVGPVALDLDLAAGDQGQRASSGRPAIGDIITVELAATEGALAAVGLLAELTFDGKALTFQSFAPADVFEGALLIPKAQEGSVEINLALIGGNAAPADAGSIGTFTFEVQEGFTDSSVVQITSGRYARSSGQEEMQIGSGGAFVVIGGASEAAAGEGPVGPIALDGDPAAGDQGSRSLPATAVGGNVTIDLVATEGAQNASGALVTFRYDDKAFSFVSFTTSDIFAGALVIPKTSPGSVELNIALTGQTKVENDAGSIGTITLNVLDGFEGSSAVELTQGSFALPEGVSPVTIGAGGATLVVGGDGAAPLTPDFDGDGTVGFADFLAISGSLNEMKWVKVPWFLAWGRG